MSGWNWLHFSELGWWWYGNGLQWTRISGPCRWDATWNEVRCESIDIGMFDFELDAGQTGPVWMWDPHLRFGLVLNVTWKEQRCSFGDLDGAEMSPGWRWEANVATWIELRHDLDGGYIWIYGPKWRWDGTWMEVRLIFDLGLGEMGLAKRWAVIWIRLREEFLDLGDDETIHGWRWEKNPGTWIQMRLGLNGSKTYTLGAWVGFRLDVHEMQFSDLEAWPAWRCEANN